MTRKKQSFPCYGMQWGNALYLYPLEESLVEQFDTPPRPNLVNETRMYGGRWAEPSPGVWTLTWSEQAAQDFYLNNILIHELGHLVDDRNTGYMDRERFAEWFAVHYGYRHSGGQDSRGYRRTVRTPASQVSRGRPSPRERRHARRDMLRGRTVTHEDAFSTQPASAGPSFARCASAGPGGTGNPSRRARIACAETRNHAARRHDHHAAIAADGLHGGAGDFFRRRAEDPRRNLVLFLLFAQRRRCEQIRVDEAGAERGDAEPVAAAFVAQRFAEADHARISSCSRRPASACRPGRTCCTR